MNRIADNASYSNMERQLQAIKRCLKIIPHNKAWDNHLLELTQKLNDLKSAPDKFNSYYSKSGWIAYESLNAPLMDQANALAENGEQSKGEQLLTDFFLNPNNTKYHIVRLRNVPGFYKRYTLLEKAYNDFCEKRFYSCIPLFLMIIDGVVDEVAKSNKGFFASDFNPNLWNSIVGHESGLAVIAKTYAKSRKKVNTEAISIPYRNGILHGKDINYDNPVVATKCLSTIFAVADWASQYTSGKHVKPQPVPPKGLIESISDLIREIREAKRQSDDIRKQRAEIEAWHPRVISDAYLATIKTGSSNVQVASPEATLLAYLEGLRAGNYGLLHDLTARMNKAVTKGKYISELKGFIGDFQICDFIITSLTDQAASITEAGIELAIVDKSNQSYTLNVPCRLIYQRGNLGTDVLARGYPGGCWYVIEFFPRLIYREYWAQRCCGVQ